MTCTVQHRTVLSNYHIREFLTCGSTVYSVRGRRLIMVWWPRDQLTGTGYSDSYTVAGIFFRYHRPAFPSLPELLITIIRIELRNSTWKTRDPLHCLSRSESRRDHDDTDRLKSMKVLLSSQQAYHKTSTVLESPVLPQQDVAG